MLTMHPNILEKNGKKEFVILPYEEFEKVREELEDFEDLKALRKAKAKESNVSTHTLAEAKEILNIAHL